MNLNTGNHPEESYQPLDSLIYAEYNKFRPEGPKPLFCYVPFNNIFFSFSGRVLSCPYNQEVELGKYPEQSVHDIWFSESGKRLRNHLEHNDLSNGCKHCKHYFDKQKFTGLKPLVFDKYDNYAQGQYPKVLEFSLSNTCNLECKMCDGTVSSSIRKNRDKLPAIPSPYDDNFVAQLDEFIPHIKEAKFYGGEPFLIPIYFKIWDKILAVNPSTQIFVITNGTCWNARIEDYLNKGNFDLAVSIDGATKKTYEHIRANANYEEVFYNLRRFNDYCQRNNKVLNVSFTCQRDNWHELPLMIDLCNELKAQIYVSYIRYPYHLAHWNLPPAELEAMHTMLAQKTFPTKTSYQKHNLQCYTDYLQYLERCAEKNRQQEQEETRKKESITSQEMKGDLNSRAKEPENSIPEPQEEALLGNHDEMRIHLFKRINSYLQMTNTGNTEQLARKELELQTKITAVFNKVSSRIREDVFYSMALNTDIDKVVEDLENHTEDELVETLRHV